MDLAAHNTVLLDIWWNMLLKFIKQISNSFPKITNGYNIKANWSFYQKSLLALQAISESCQTSKMELFVKIRRTVHYSGKNLILDIWQGCKYASELDSKVKDVSFLNQFEYHK